VRQICSIFRRDVLPNKDATFSQFINDYINRTQTLVKEINSTSFNSVPDVTNGKGKVVIKINNVYEDIFYKIVDLVDN
jgi:hypothetical protein